MFALCAPLLGIYPVFMMKLLCFAMFACAYNLLLGFSGMLSFGHAAFFRLRRLRHRLACHGARLGGAAGDPRRRCGVGACWAASSALIAIRRRGIYFAMITLALAQLIYFVCLEAPFTGGENGLQGVPRGSLFWACCR